MTKSSIVMPADLASVINACGIDYARQSSRHVVANLEDYLKHLCARTAVIERCYIDRDYTEDYAQYYSRCFKNYARTCHRVHFFASDLDEAALNELLVAGEQGREKLQENYLGFVVFRPLPETIVGRTCLVPYDQCDTGRHYPAVTTVRVSLWGVPLFVRCMPFQEQDSNVAACATCALWSALHAASARFECQVSSPSHITSMAMAHERSRARSFPNHGVSENDMIYAIRRSGLDPMVVDIEDADLLLRKNKFLGNVYAYLNCGIPVIAIVSIIRKNGASSGCHAVTINGYHLGEPKTSTLPDSSRLLACSIDKIYANDDQLVPYSRIVVQTDRGELELQSSWKYEEDLGYRCRFDVHSLIMPLYHKIRVGYDEVWNVVNEFGQMVALYSKEYKDVPIIWDIRLQEGSAFKTEIRNEEVICKADKLEILRWNMPRYLWVVRVDVDGSREAEYCIDATDAGQGLHVERALLFSDVAIEIADAIYKTGKCLDNILVNATRTGGM